MPRKKEEKMYGYCIRCGFLIIRTKPVDVAVCRCSNPGSIVQLYDYSEFRRRLAKVYGLGIVIERGGGK